MSFPCTLRSIRAFSTRPASWTSSDSTGWKAWRTATRRFRRVSGDARVPVAAPGQYLDAPSARRRALRGLQTGLGPGRFRSARVADAVCVDEPVIDAERLERERRLDPSLFAREYEAEFVGRGARRSG